MTNRINLHLKRTLDQYSDFSFSTEHDTDLVDKWLKETPEELDKYLMNPINLEWETDWDDPYQEDYRICHFDFNNNSGEEEDDDYDNHPYFDETIKTWKIEQTIDMNLIFSSECEVQKITDFINENDKLFKSITKKNLVDELTEDEKKVWFELQQIVKLNSKSKLVTKWLKKEKKKENQDPKPF